ncbi:MAG: DUF302 domain-containing protein [Calditrichia bacterium]|nr:DUF302 domain-containing protein [Calditrichia bacterium]
MTILLFIIGLVLGFIIMALMVKGMMPNKMFATYKSKLDFDETVSSLEESAKKNGWTIPEIRDLQQDYIEAGLEDMTKVKILYFCNAQGGYDILKNDDYKKMSVMMPMGVSIYETNDGQVKIAAMNIGFMSMMFSGTVKKVLQNGGGNFRNSVKNVIEK